MDTYIESDRRHNIDKINVSDDGVVMKNNELTYMVFAAVSLLLLFIIQYYIHIQW